MVLSIAFCVRIRLLTVPLERDEGEFAYMGQLILKGIPPYTHAYTMKLPGVSTIYALIMALFGQTPAGIHLGFLVVNGICTALVFLLARQLYDRDTALISCSCYALLSLSQSVFGIAAHATHFVTLFSLAGFILLRSPFKSDRIRTVFLFLSGLCFGLAVTMKQHAVLQALFAPVYLAKRGAGGPACKTKYSAGRIALFLAGSVIPYAIVVFSAGNAGVFDKFWFWTVHYAGNYSTGPTFAEGVRMLVSSFSALVKPQLLLWFLAGVGAATLLTQRGRNSDRFFLTGFAIFSFLAVCPGFYFRSHYFVLILPVVALLIGNFFHAVRISPTKGKPGRFQIWAPILLICSAISYGIFQEREYLFTLPPNRVSRTLFVTNPFPEALQIAHYIKDHCSPDDRIAVFGSEPELYFYADRLSATGHIYMYGLMEYQPYAEQMQQEMIREIALAKPKYIVMVHIQKSWLARPSSINTVIDWADSYVHAQYDLVGGIDIIDFYTTRYLWDERASGYTPISDSFLTVFKRRENAN